MLSTDANRPSIVLNRGGDELRIPPPSSPPSKHVRMMQSNKPDIFKRFDSIIASCALLGPFSCETNNSV